MFSNTEELLPVISFNAKASADEAKKHEDFVTRMVAKGYTPKQVRNPPEAAFGRLPQRARRGGDSWSPWGRRQRPGKAASAAAAWTYSL